MSVEPEVWSYLTVGEVAARLNVTTSAVLMRINRGQLKAVKRAGRWFIHPQDILVQEVP